MSSAEWFCKIADREIGPLTSEQLAHMGRAEQLLPTDQVRKGRSGDWTEAKRVKGLTFGPASPTAADEAPPPPTPVPVPAEPKQEPAAKYYTFIGQKRNGPFTREQLTSQLLPSDALVWRQGLPDWVSPYAIPELQEHLPPPDPVPIAETHSASGLPQPESPPPSPVTQPVAARSPQVARIQSTRPSTESKNAPASAKSTGSNAGEIVLGVLGIGVAIVVLLFLLPLFNSATTYVKGTIGFGGMMLLFGLGRALFGALERRSK